MRIAGPQAEREEARAQGPRLLTRESSRAALSRRPGLYPHNTEQGGGHTATASLSQLAQYWHAQRQPVYPLRPSPALRILTAHRGSRVPAIDDGEATEGSREKDPSQPET
jgi:hypothetical protein